MLSLSQVNSYPLLGGFAVADISFQLQPLQKLAVIGATGSGKSTLLKIIAGLLQHASGTIIYNNEKILGPNYKLIPGVIGIAYLSRHFELWHNYKMQDVLAYNNQMSASDSQILYHHCKIDHLMQRNSKQLSGGEKQRIALAKLLVTKPQVLILDEPFSNLDVVHKKELKQVLANVLQQYNISCIMTSHEPTDILPWADNILVMQNGMIVQQGSPQQVFRQPINNYVAGLLGAYICITDTIRTEFKIDVNLKYLRANQIVIVAESSYKAKVISCDYYGDFFKVIVNYKDELFAINSLQQCTIDSILCLQIIV